MLKHRKFANAYNYETCKGNVPTSGGLKITNVKILTQKSKYGSSNKIVTPLIFISTAKQDAESLPQTVFWWCYFCD